MTVFQQTVSQLLIKDISNPFTLIFVGNPSSGKSSVLDFVLGCEDKTYRSDNFTSAAFVSQASNITEEKLKDNDLLKKIKNKVLVVRDLAPLFGKRYEKIKEDISILTVVMDGQGYTRDAGTHGRRGYIGKTIFMFLGATPTFREEILQIIGGFGSRIVFYNLPTKYKDGMEIALELTSDNAYRSRIIKCKKITRQYVDELWEENNGCIRWDRKKDDLDLVKEIGDVSNLGACLRAPVEVYEERIEQETRRRFEAKVEGPMRLANSLYNLCRGHAVVCGRKTISRDDIPMVLRLALDSAPKERVKIFCELIVGNGFLTTADIAEILKCTRPTALYKLREFASFGIADEQDNQDLRVGRKERALRLTSKFLWCKGERFKKLLLAYNCNTFN